MVRIFPIRCSSTSTIASRCDPLPSKRTTSSVPLSKRANPLLPPALASSPMPTMNWIAAAPPSLPKKGSSCCATPPPSSASAAAASTTPHSSACRITSGRCTTMSVSCSTSPGGPPSLPSASRWRAPMAFPRDTPWPLGRSGTSRLLSPTQMRRLKYVSKAWAMPSPSPVPSEKRLGGMPTSTPSPSSAGWGLGRGEDADGWRDGIFGRRRRCSRWPSEEGSGLRTRGR
mmetsp:Transcript_18234/g.41582  ORF Transcript_18234/g.41582 Transcript_18234/m.41582 type:complete len:229 (+) Transcript_18234:3409-4095(+)